MLVECQIPFTEMRDKWITGVVNGKDIGLSSGNRNTLAEYTNQYGRFSWHKDASWYGASLSEMTNRIRNGFVVDGLDLTTAQFPIRKRVRPTANDYEGDFRYDSFMSGDENCFTKWSKRETVPGIIFEYGIGFTGNVKESTIANYSRWVCEALLAFEQAGIDTEISAFCIGVSRFTGGSYSEELRWTMPVKRMGEKTDYLSWSALFSPGCYRLLGFFTNILAAQKLGRVCSAEMGSSSSRAWNVSWNSDERKIVISHNSHEDYDFPREKMTEQLFAAIASARG